MSKTDEFIRKVRDMREAQMQYEEKRTSTNEREKIKRETLVDEWLLEFDVEQIQLELWAGACRTDETPGAYNVEHETKDEEGSAP